jgi:hypothetical protein
MTIWILDGPVFGGSLYLNTGLSGYQNYFVQRTSFAECARSDGGKVSSLQLAPIHLNGPALAPLVDEALLYRQTTRRRPWTSQAQPLGETDTLTSDVSAKKVENSMGK